MKLSLNIQSSTLARWTPFASTWALLLLIVTNCSVSGAHEPAEAEVEENQPPADTVEVAKPLPFTLNRKIRRIKLDTTHRLPETLDFELVGGTAAGLNKLVDQSVTTTEAANTIADLHRQAWQMRSKLLPDLERFIADGDTVLSANLDASMRHMLIQEPLNLIAYTVQTKRPYGQLFTLDKTITSPEVADLWGYQLESVIGSNKNQILASFPDGRPGLGLLATNGLWATFDSENRSQNDSRTWSLLENIMCLDMDVKSAHDFRDLEDSDIDSGLRDHAYSSQNCSGCHRQHADLSQALAGLASGSSFGAWTYYSNNTTQPSGVYRGQAYSNFEELSQLLANDPRFKLCSLQNMNSIISQRDFNQTYDSETVFSAMNMMIQRNDRMDVGYRWLLKGSNYLQAPFTADTTSVSTLSSKNGIRVLSSRHWKGIAEQLLPGIELSFPEHLDPGFTDIQADRRYDPSNTYWHAAEAAARRIAYAITEYELNAKTPKLKRKVFKQLPEGIGQTSDQDLIQAQIIDLWKILTTYELSSGDRILDRLLELQQVVMADGSEESTKESWQVILTAVMLHEAFITY